MFFGISTPFADGRLLNVAAEILAMPDDDPFISASGGAVGAGAGEDRD